MNPAKRVLSIYEKALNLSEQNPQNNGAINFLYLWARVFGISENAEHTHEDEVTVALMAFRDEIEAAKARLRQKGCPENLFDGHLTRVKSLASATLLHQEWASHKRGLQNDTLLALQWAAWVLPEEEETVSDEEMTELSAELDAMEQAVAGSGLSAHLKAFVSRQITLIRSALRLYPVVGIAPIEKALEQSIGALTKNKTVVAEELDKAEPETKSFVARFTGFLSKTAEIADKTDKIRKGTESAVSMAKAVAAAVNGVASMLPPG